ncbi:hypothetical protein BH10PSE18_BH10PSE18_38730 [soil metagenome]
MDSVISGFLIFFPFASPIVAGPSSAAWQLLGAWSCIALLLLSGAAVPSRALICWLASTAALIAIAAGDHHALQLTAVAAVLMTGFAACVGAATVGDTRKSSSLAWGVLAAGCLSAVFGLFQYYGAAKLLFPWTSAPEIGQAYGNLRQRNQFATLISMALVAALWLHGHLSGRSGRMRAALLPAAVLLTLAAAASTSRTGLLQWLSISIVAAFIAWRERRPAAADRGRGYAHRLPHPLLALALIPAYFLAAWALPQLAGATVEGMLLRLRDGAPEGHSRLLLWRNVLDLIAAHPWRGWGWGELSFAHYSFPYQGERFVELLDNAHNLPLQLAVELGVPAALLICGGFAWLVLAARPWRERDPLRLMAWGMLGAIVLHSLLEYPLWYGPFQLVFGVCLGVLWPGRRRTRNPKTADNVAPRGAAWYQVAALLLVIAIGYAGWDYTRISRLYMSPQERPAAGRQPGPDTTLDDAHASWLYMRYVRFAELVSTPVDRDNAAHVHDLAQRSLHFSPEPRVIGKLIDSASLLGEEQEASAQSALFKRAYPEEYAAWLAARPAGARSN